MGKISIDLKDIHISSGVNEQLVPFCTVSVNHGDLLGQLSPEEVRQMALQWLAAAEAAEQDAVVFGVFTQDMELGYEQAATFVTAMRSRRS